jgi:hypothetical protein
MNNKTAVEQLIDKAVKTEKSEDALRFSQAACNAANALICVVNREKLVTN